MKHKVAELEGALLDAAVALALGWQPPTPWMGAWVVPSSVPSGIDGERIDTSTFAPLYPWSTDWSLAGPIIEREQISLVSKDRGDGEHWRAHIPGALDGPEPATAIGPTPLIAAMRVYVASNFGDEVELP